MLSTMLFVFKPVLSPVRITHCEFAEQTRQCGEAERLNETLKWRVSFNGEFAETQTSRIIMCAFAHGCGIFEN